MSQEQQPSLADQLKAVSRMAMNLQVSITSMCDVIESQAKEIERLRELAPHAQSAPQAIAQPVVSVVSAAE